MQETCSDRTPYRGRGAFTIIAHIAPALQAVGIPHRPRMRREASPVALRRRSMQYVENSVPRMYLPRTPVNRDERRARMRCPSPMMASALRRLVAEIENARAEDLRVDKLQRLLIAPVFKQTLSAPHHDGMDHEPKFVEEVLFKQRPDQGRAAGYRDILARLLLEPGDLLGDVVPYQGRVLPLEGLLEGRRDHVLLDAVHPCGDRVLIRVLLRPERRPLLVEDAAHEHSVRGCHRRPDRISHLIVEVWEVPLLRRLHDAVKRHELRCDDFPHKDLL